MSYHTFLNFGQLLQADLIKKLNKGIHSLDYVDHVCNCNRNNLNENGECLYRGNCQRKFIIYKATCQTTNRFYVGSTANGLKTRMNGHYNDVKKY